MTRFLLILSLLLFSRTFVGCPTAVDDDDSGAANHDVDATGDDDGATGDDDDSTGAPALALERLHEVDRDTYEWVLKRPWADGTNTSRFSETGPHTLPDSVLSGLPVP